MSFRLSLQPQWFLCLFNHILNVCLKCRFCWPYLSLEIGIQYHSNGIIINNHAFVRLVLFPFTTSKMMFRCEHDALSTNQRAISWRWNLCVYWSRCYQTVPCAILGDSSLWLECCLWEVREPFWILFSVKNIWLEDQHL